MELRLDVCMCQAAAALVTSFCTTIELLLAQNDRVGLEQIGALGYMVQWESLLSTNGDEKGMVEDFVASVGYLRCFGFRFVREFAAGSAAPTHGASPPRSSAARRRWQRALCKVRALSAFARGSPSFEVRTGAASSRRLACTDRLQLRAEGASYVFLVRLPGQLWSRLPASLRAKARPIRVVPVLFQQGINEKAKLNDYIGGNAMEKDINRMHLNHITQYCRGVKRFLHQRAQLGQPQPPLTAAAGDSAAQGVGPELAGSKEAIAMRIAELEKLEGALAHAVALESPTQRNYDILFCAASLTNALRGGRVTSCKSGKDRTAMSVTLEQSALLCRNHDAQLPLRPLGTCARGGPGDGGGGGGAGGGGAANGVSVQQLALANMMRLNGLRLTNAQKNMGEAKYAFNVVQRKMLPEPYRPPVEALVSISRGARKSIT